MEHVGVCEMFNLKSVDCVFNEKADCCVFVPFVFLSIFCPHTFEKNMLNCTQKLSYSFA